MNDAHTNTTIEEVLRQNAELAATLEQYQAQIALLSKESLAKSAELQRLHQKLQALLHRLYGRRSEKDHPGQLYLFDQDEPAPTPPAEPIAPDDESVLEPSAPKKRRKPRVVKTRDAQQCAAPRRIARSLRGQRTFLMRFAFCHASQRIEILVLNFFRSSASRTSSPFRRHCRFGL